MLYHEVSVDNSHISLDDPYIPQGDYGSKLTKAQKERRSQKLGALRLALIVVSAGLVLALVILTRGFGLFAGNEVPNVLGQTEDSAKEILTHAGFKVEVVVQHTDSIEDQGLVLATKPPAGELAGTGSTISVMVGDVGEPTQVAPNLVGLSEQDALNTIASTNFFVKDDISYETTDTAAPDTVIHQDPAAGTAGIKGTKIDLVIAQSAQ